MDRVLVTTNKNPIFYININLTDKEWESLLPDKLPPFKIEELKRPCSSYPNGIFPGAEDNQTNKQIFRVHKFSNYVEFSKIVADEVVAISDQNFLTTKFYNRRKKGWSSEKIIKKSGDIQGYCVNGDVYGVSNKDAVDKIFYGVVYYSLIYKMPEFINLQKYLRDGLCIILTGADNNFLGHFSEVLLMSIRIG